MGVLRPQAPALLAAGAFGGNFQIGSLRFAGMSIFLR